jgi:F0F1-type ATP synthase assembly protein I
MSEKNELNKSGNESLNYVQKVIQSSGPVASSSYSLLSSVILGLVIGYYIDQKNSTSPYGLLICLFIGMGAGFYQLAKLMWHKK